VKFNTASLDDFDRWSDSRDARASRTEDIIVRSLPHEVRSYAYGLSDYGDWYQEPDYGYVWYPRVEAGWAPYSYGHWGYTGFGHTWISSEPWGWAPYHYGRWGFGHRGWYWIPGATWGPAWVSFAIGPTWVGWSPLGYHGGPVFAFNAYFGGHGVYRHFPRWGGGHHRGGWNVCSRDDFRSGVVTRAGYRRLAPADVRGVDNARFVDEVTSLDRELNSRAARLRPSASTHQASASSGLRPASRGFAEAAGARPTLPRSDHRLEGTLPRLDDRVRSDEALRRFRERAASPSARVVDRSARTLSPRDERPNDVSEIGRGARGLPGSGDSDDRPRLSPGERRGSSLSRSSARETPAAEGRERLERARERRMPVAPSREMPSKGSSSRGEPRESRRVREIPSGTRAPVTRAPEASTGPRTRVERAAPRASRTGNAPARDIGGGSRSSRERSSSVRGPSTSSRGSSSGAAHRSGGSQSPRGGASARPRSNRN
jgi:hypothetical protein